MSVYFSPLRRALEQALRETGTGSQWMGDLFDPERVVRSARRDPNTNRPLLDDSGAQIVDERIVPRQPRVAGLRPAEFEDSAFDTYLNAQPDREFTRQELLRYLDGYGMKFSETVYGSPPGAKTVDVDPDDINGPVMSRADAERDILETYEDELYDLEDEYSRSARDDLWENTDHFDGSDVEIIPFDPNVTTTAPRIRYPHRDTLDLFGPASGYTEGPEAQPKNIGRYAENVFAPGAARDEVNPAPLYREGDPVEYFLGRPDSNQGRIVRYQTSHNGPYQTRRVDLDQEYDPVTFPTYFPSKYYNYSSVGPRTQPLNTGPFPSEDDAKNILDIIDDRKYEWFDEGEWQGSHEEHRAMEDARQALIDRYIDQYHIEGDRNTAVVSVPYANSRYVTPGGTNQVVILGRVEQNPLSDESYREGHFTDGRNVVFHIRGNWRIDNQGRRVFHVEELQSLLQTHGFHHGYRKQKSTPKSVRFNDTASPYDDPSIAPMVTYQAIAPDGLSAQSFSSRADALDRLRIAHQSRGGEDSAAVRKAYQEAIRRETDAHNALAALADDPGIKPYVETLRSQKGDYDAVSAVLRVADATDASDGLPYAIPMDNPGRAKILRAYEDWMHAQKQTSTAVGNLKRFTEQNRSYTNADLTQATDEYYAASNRESEAIRAYGELAKSDEAAPFVNAVLEHHTPKLYYADAALRLTVDPEYAAKGLPGAIPEGHPLRARIFAATEAKRRARDAASVALNRRDTIQNYFRSSQRKQPDFPLKGTAWIKVAMERILRYASDNGAERISWTPASIQDDRYPGVPTEIYEDIMPNLFNKLLKKYKVKSSRETGILSPEQHNRFGPVPVIDLPSDARNFYIDNGVSIYSAGLAALLSSLLAAKERQRA
jgi:hypothetical protein